MHGHEDYILENLCIQVTPNVKMQHVEAFIGCCSVQQGNRQVEEGTREVHAGKAAVASSG